MEDIQDISEKSLVIEEIDLDSNETVIERINDSPSKDSTIFEDQNTEFDWIMNKVIQFNIQNFKNDQKSG